MQTSAGKIFIAVLLGVGLALGGTTWLSSRSQGVRAQTEPASAPATATALAETAPQPGPSANQVEAATTDNAQVSTYEQGYRAGYQDAHRDCTVSRTSGAGYAPRRAYSAPRARVAGVRYVHERPRGHSTRNMILRIAAPAAIGAGIGAIAGGGKGAGAGALIGGGAGAIYHLIKH
ncbi:MAG TPA: hypothetical protein VKM94_02670 [Blastocatellia bacterium]|nr:hypothetical protein [Blastocatellia bacterium]